MWNDPCIPIFQNIANQIWTPCCMFGQNAPPHTVLEYRCIFLVWTHELSFPHAPFPPQTFSIFFCLWNAYGRLSRCWDRHNLVLVFNLKIYLVSNTLVANDNFMSLNALEKKIGTILCAEVFGLNAVSFLPHEHMFGVCAVPPKTKQFSLINNGQDGTNISTPSHFPKVFVGIVNANSEPTFAVRGISFFAKG